MGVGSGIRTNFVTLPGQARHRVACCRVLCPVRSSPQLDRAEGTVSPAVSSCGVQRQGANRICARRCLGPYPPCSDWNTKSPRRAESREAVHQCARAQALAGELQTWTEADLCKVAVGANTPSHPLSMPATIGVPEKPYPAMAHGQEGARPEALAMTEGPPGRGLIEAGVEPSIGASVAPITRLSGGVGRRCASTCV